MNVAEIQNGQVVRAIKGTVEWATENLGGMWVDCGDAKPGPGWSYESGEFRAPAPFPSWVWADGAWVPPVPRPERVEGFVWSWNESAGDWQQVAIPSFA